MNKKKYNRLVGKKIRKLRGKERQVDFAKRCGLSQAQISQYERGENSPKVVNIIKICDATGTNLSDFLNLGRETKERGRRS